MPKATLKLVSPHANAVMGALSPEIGREVPRTQVQIDSNDHEVTLEIEASDISALRAAINSYLRWMWVSEEIGNMVGEENG